VPVLTIAGAQPAELGEIRGLLASAGLSLEGVAGSLGGFLLAREDGRLVATACLEDHGTSGLLRSVATVPDRRGRGLAACLVRSLIQRAQARGHEMVYLLTTTAQGYFERFGFRRIERTEVRPEMLEAGQFKGQRCESSVVMVLDLRRGPTV
jgi:amino-acid N-acetyltransferase